VLHWDPFIPTGFACAQPSFKPSLLGMYIYTPAHRWVPASVARGTMPDMVKRMVIMR
jgi:hypothetical protein